MMQVLIFFFDCGVMVDLRAVVCKVVSLGKYILELNLSEHFSVSLAFRGVGFISVFLWLLSLFFYVFQRLVAVSVSPHPRVRLLLWGEFLGGGAA